MKQHILPAIRLTIVTLVFFCVVYTFVIWAIAQLGPAKGDGETVKVNGKVVGYALEGQSFTTDKYFWSRPSAVGYNAAGSGGSNKGPSNPDYLKDVQSRIDTFLVHNPGIKKEDIPSELVTAVRKIAEEKISNLVDQSIEKPFLGLFGTEKVNVLKLNIALDKLGNQ